MIITDAIGSCRAPVATFQANQNWFAFQHEPSIVAHELTNRALIFPTDQTAPRHRSAAKRRYF